MSVSKVGLSQIDMSFIHLQMEQQQYKLTTKLGD